MTDRLCPHCRKPMTGEKPTAVYHATCRRERDRAYQRLWQRARRSGQPMVRACPLCSGPREKGRRMCDPCAKERDREHCRRYARSDRGRERARRTAQKPARKMYVATYDDKNRDRIRALARARERARSKVGTEVPCATVLCGGTFIRRRYNSRQQFCDECRAIFWPHLMRRERQLRRAA